MKKKVIRLNEQDIENLVKKIIKEDGDSYPEGWTDEMEGRYQKEMDVYLNDFEWTDSVPKPGQYNIEDLEDLILSKKLRIGYKVRLIGHAKDVDLVFNNVGTISDVYEIHNKYLDGRYDDTGNWVDDEGEYEYGAKILLDDVDGFNMYEYEINDTSGDQDDLTFEIISDRDKYFRNRVDESEFDWATNHLDVNRPALELDLSVGKPFIIEFDIDITEAHWHNILTTLKVNGWRWRIGDDDYYEPLSYASFICGGEEDGNEYPPSAISGGESNEEMGIVGYWCSDGYNYEHPEGYYGDRHYKLSQMEGKG
jgi:hypothetical protein